MFFRVVRVFRGYQSRWEPLTLFLRQAGVPLDNNVCERTLKRAIMHRKNAMFYRTRTGARVGVSR
ncbi:MAG: transposase [Planctomyces sp.]|nr:transposase [Planctomyces sp.]